MVDGDPRPAGSDLDRSLNAQNQKGRRWLLFAGILALLAGLLASAPFVGRTLWTVLVWTALGALLVANVASHRSAARRGFFPLTFALGAFILALLLQGPVASWVLGPFCTAGRNCSVSGLVVLQLSITSFVVAPIVGLTLIRRQPLSTLYLGLGRCPRLGLAIGFLVFAASLAAAPVLSHTLFGGPVLTLSRLVALYPLAVGLAATNGVREELWFRGLMLPPSERTLGAAPANYLQALVFMSAHVGVTYTPFLLEFLLLTFGLGLAFGHLIQETGSLYGAIVAHAGVDVPIYIVYLAAT
ncbi:MAG: CPBP family intramembrane metalloprotease [Thermoplasmata archaeon]|nr:CPBP family intramembrane metalloprotease [Thermoplasmata archaeon]